MNEYGTSPCKNCPDRRVGCHSAACSKWAEFEEKKQKSYTERNKQSEHDYYERKYIRDTYKRFIRRSK